MGKKILIPICLAFFLILIAFSSAKLTASIGNSRIVLDAEVGETIEKSILVKNVNDVPVTIELSASGNLADDVKLQEESFVLQPGADKKAYFSIKIKKPGTTETKINVKFVPEEGNGVGLSSSIMIRTSGDPAEYEEEQNGIVNVGTTGHSVENTDEPSELSLLSTMGILAIILVVVFLSLFVRYKRINLKKEGRRSRA